jgi:hypothetical protein
LVDQAVGFFRLPPDVDPARETVGFEVSASTAAATGGSFPSWFHSR